MFDHLFFGDYFKNKQKQINLGELTLKHKVLVGKNIFTWDLGGKPLKISPPGPPWPFRRRLRRALRRPLRQLRQLRQLQRLGRRRRRRHGFAVLGELDACGCRPVPAGWNTKGELSNLSMDWIKGKSTGNHGFNHQI